MRNAILLRDMADIVPTSGAATPSSTPSATPSAPSTTTSSAPSSSAAPVAAPDSGTGTPAPAATPAVEDTRSTEQILRDKLTPIFSKDGKGGEPNPDFDPNAEVDGADGTAPATDENAEVKVEPTKEAAAAESTEEDPFPDFTLAEPTGFGPKTLAAALEADPTAAAALEKNPELKASIFANARKAERAMQYDEILGSPAEAKVVVEGHNAFNTVSIAMADVKDGDDASYYAATNALLAQTYVRDEDGNPVKNPDGTFQTDGTVGRYNKNVFRTQLDRLYQEAEARNDEDAQAAIDILMERSGLRPSNAGNEEELSESLKAQKAEIDREKAALDQRRQTERQQDSDASDSRVVSSTDRVLDSSIQSILAKSSALDNFTRTKVDGDIRRGLNKAIRASNTYQAERRNIERRPLGPKREKDLIELNKRTIMEKLPSIARPILAEAGVSLAAKSTQRQSDQAAREAAARSENRSSMAPARPAAANPADMTTVINDLTAKLGRTPTTEQILAERMIRRGQATATR